MPIKWDNYRIATTFITNKIIIGKVNKDGDMFLDKSPDRTDQAIQAVAAYMKRNHQDRLIDEPNIKESGFEFPGEGKLMWIPADKEEKDD